MNDAPLAKARNIFDLEIAELQKLRDRLDASFAGAVELFQSAVEQGKKIVIVGVGKSGHIGEKLAATLTSTGSPAVVLNALNSLHGDLGIVQDGDVILALSYSGETEELNNLVPALLRFDVKIVAMTGNSRSFLAQHAAVHLDVHVDQEACPLQLAPTSSTTSMLVLGDALAMVLLEARGFSREDFAKFHPGGRLGRALLLKVRQIMRGPEQLALLHPGARVRDAIHAMARARSGCAIVVEESGQLAGVFTHGDFGRQFDKDAALLDKEVALFMTRHPVTIGAERLAVEVLHVLESHRIDDLVVLDENGAPVGLVDTQDLARFRLL